jgi:hypothetical protein
MKTEPPVTATTDAPMAAHFNGTQFYTVERNRTVIGFFYHRDDAKYCKTAMNALPLLVNACADALQSLKRLPDADGAYRITVMQQLQQALALAGKGEERG